MPDNKKHHYVPKFYLRRFSGDGKSINLYNIAAKKKVLTASLRNQCYRDYFYGRDQVAEKELAAAEGEMQTLLMAMDRAVIPPRPGTLAHRLMLFFILSQYGRTTYAAETADVLLDKYARALLKETAREKGIDLTRVGIHLTEPGSFALGIALNGYGLLIDMQYKMLVNRTQEEFILSDNPVVLYNQLLSFRSEGGNTGMACKGLQIFVPLDPYKTLVMFDDNVYRCGSDAQRIIDITNPRDVYQLNTLQFASAEENIYFLRDDYDPEPLHKKAARYRRTDHVKFHEFEERSEGSITSKVLLHTHTDIQTNLDLTFMKLRRSAKQWRDAFRRAEFQPATVVRNPELVQSHEEFMKAVKRQEYEPFQFLEYLDRVAKTKAAVQHPPSSDNH